VNEIFVCNRFGGVHRKFFFEKYKIKEKLTSLGLKVKKFFGKLKRSRVGRRRVRLAGEIFVHSGVAFFRNL